MASCKESDTTEGFSRSEMGKKDSELVPERQKKFALEFLTATGLLTHSLGGLLKASRIGNISYGAQNGFPVWTFIFTIIS